MEVETLHEVGIVLNLAFLMFESALIGYGGVTVPLSTTLYEDANKGITKTWDLNL